MSRLPRPLRRLLCRLCYLLPALFGILLLIHAAVPSFWYVYQQKAMDTHSLFSLEGSVWAWTQTPTAQAESGLSVLLLRAWCVLFWVLPIVFGILAALSAICSLLAFSLPPVTTASNRIKRVLHLLCPNRICFLLFQFFPVAAALLPQVLLFCYVHLMGMEMRLAGELFWDWSLALCFALVSSLLFFLTLPLQREERLDMFCIYKSKNTLREEAEE